MCKLISCYRSFRYSALAATFLYVTACAYSYRPIDYPDPGVQETIAQGISNSGVIVGYFRSRSEPFKLHGFLRDARGNFTKFDFPDASDTRAFKITPGGGGQIVGITSSHGFIKDGETYDTIDFITNPPKPLPTYAYGINSFGQVVGVYFDAVGIHGYVDEANAFRTLDVPGEQETNVTAINDKQAIVGFVNGSQSRGFTGDLNSHYVFFTAPGAKRTEAWGINDGGDIVGFADGGANDSFMRAANGVMTSIKVPQGSLTRAYGINDQGQIVGSYVDGAGTHGFLANPPCRRRDCKEQGPPR